MADRRAPRFLVGSMLFPAFFLYVLMSSLMSFVLLPLLTLLPSTIAAKAQVLASGMAATEITLGMEAEATDGNALAGLALTVGPLALGYAVILFRHRHLRRWFKLRRKNRLPADSEALRGRALKELKHSALTFGLVPMVLQGLALLLSLFGPLDSRIAGNADLYHLVNVVMLLAGAVYLWYWQQQRIHRCYLPHVCTPLELGSAYPLRSRMRLRGTFAVLVGVGLILPLAFVLILFFSSMVTGTRADVSTARDAMILGVQTMGMEALPEFAYLDVPHWFVVVLGLFLGLPLMGIYIVNILRWALQDIRRPVADLQAGIKALEAGRFDELVPIRTANEIGAVAASWNTMLRGMAERERIQTLIHQYLPQEVARRVIEEGVQLSGDAYDATVLYVDIRGFTTLSETMAPEAIFSFINRYLEGMVQAVEEHGGMVDKFMGDGMLAVFGVPVRSDDHARRAVRCALSMLENLARFNARLRTGGEAEVRVGIGIHTGPLIAGNVGTAGRLQFTVIGDTVNTASRIEQLTKDFATSLLVSASTWQALADTELQAALQSRGAVALRGKADAVELYALEVFSGGNP